MTGKVVKGRIIHDLPRSIGAEGPAQALPSGVKKDGHFHFAPLNLQVVQEEKWSGYGNMRNVVLVWIAKQLLLYNAP